MAMLLPELSRYPELLEVLDRPKKIMFSIVDLIRQYQNEDILRPENPFHVLSSLLGPLMYTTFMRGSLFDADLPSIDLQQYIVYFLRGRQVSLNKNPDSES